MICKKLLNGFALVLLLALVLALAACTTSDVYSQSSNSKVPDFKVPDFKVSACENKLWQQTSLFLGRSINTGGEVSEADWHRFMSETVIPNFPDGFSVVDAKGFWNNAGTTEHEKSKILIILHTGTPVSRGKIDNIAQIYIEKFQQKYVIGGSSIICPHFYENKE